MRLSGLLVICVVVLAAGLPCPGFAASILRVKASATGTNSGASWANAFVDLQAALAAAKEGDEIWVAAGIYKPASDNDRLKSFLMPDEVALYGGFAGIETETAREQRDWKAHQTILSGEMGDPENHADNSRRVVIGGINSILDGFTVTGGYAEGDIGGGGMTNYKGAVTVANCTFSGNTSGGAMFNDQCSPVIFNCTFSNNLSPSTAGGAMCNRGGAPTVTSCTFSGNSSGAGGALCITDSMPTVTNCTFIGNTASQGGGMFITHDCSVINCTFIDNRADGSIYGEGGGIYAVSSTKVTNCVFRGNVAVVSGGGMYNYQNSPTVTNCIFSGNSVYRVVGSPKYGGGGMGNYNSSPMITNCTFSGNWAPNQGGYGGGMHNLGGAPIVTNCIIWANDATTGPEIYRYSGNPTFIHCDIAGFRGIKAINDGTRGNDGGGNIEADPKFPNFSNPLGLDNTWRTRDDGLLPLSNSPCINAGTVTGAPATDILGNPRGGLPDIGAYEYMINSPILRYLLGLDTDPTGLDANGDGQVDSADLVKSLKAPH